MPDLQHTLATAFRRAIADAFGEEYADTDPLIRPSNQPKFGDYQANVAMSLAKQLGRKPRDVAAAVIEKLDLGEVADKPDIAGPGFINITLSDAFLNERVAALAFDERLGVAPTDQPQTVVVDYSSPNVAKEMHVGHLRSTILGDAIARVLSFQGHHVIRQNHLGDWGTQFGMLIEHLIDLGVHESSDHSISDLNQLYQEAKAKDDRDPAFAERARRRVVKLQSGDEETLNLWQTLIDESTRHFNAIYRRLGVLLTDEDLCPESFYNPRLPDTVRALEEAGKLEISQGAAVVFPAGFEDRDGNPLPMIVRKSDGGYLYATTDLAAVRYRVGELNADRIIYVTDARQSQHFAMVFATVREVAWAPPSVRLDHVAFGTILGPDHRPFKTRAGGTVRLVDLLDEAQQRAGAVIAEKNPDLPDETRQAIAHAVGAGALKYADLSNDRIKDYVFEWNRMLSFDGNTAPYLQYSYVRIRSIFRRGEVNPQDLQGKPVTLHDPAERALAIKLLQFPAVIDAVAQSLEPHRLCNYLYELASLYHKFFESCPVLRSEAATKESRLILCHAVAGTLHKGLALLGIDTIEQM